MTLLLRFLPHLIVVALLAAGAIYLHHTGYESGKKEIQTLWDKDKARVQKLREKAEIKAANAVKGYQDEISTIRNAPKHPPVRLCRLPPQSDSDSTPQGTDQGTPGAGI